MSDASSYGLLLCGFEWMLLLVVLLRGGRQIERCRRDSYTQIEILLLDEIALQ